MWKIKCTRQKPSAQTHNMPIKWFLNRTFFRHIRLLSALKRCAVLHQINTFDSHTHGPDGEPISSALEIRFMFIRSLDDKFLLELNDLERIARFVHWIEMRSPSDIFLKTQITFKLSTFAALPGRHTRTQ